MQSHGQVLPPPHLQMTYAIVARSSETRQAPAPEGSGPPRQAAIAAGPPSARPAVAAGSSSVARLSPLLFGRLRTEKISAAGANPERVKSGANRGRQTRPRLCRRRCSGFGRWRRLAGAGADRAPRQDAHQADIAAHRGALASAHGTRQAEQDGKGAKQRQDAETERFHTGTLARGRFPETSQLLDRERLFRYAPIFHLTDMRECINSWGTGLAKAACLTPRRHFRPIDKNRFPARGMSQVLLMAIFSREPSRSGTSMPVTVFRKALP